jgi:GTP-binding protein
MRAPLIAVVGRPNVGKSTFLNTIAGSAVSIVSPESGTTRDRVYADTEWAGHCLTLIDTGGLDFDEMSNAFSAHIKEQVDIAVDLADCIVFLTDGSSGVTPDDHAVASYLRRVKKPVVLAVNKLDNDKLSQNLYDFYQLKIGDPYGISCAHKTGLGELLDAITEKLPKVSPDQVSATARIAIVGKPNSGKSSITNRLLGEKRVMVSDIAGTTRDSIDSNFRHNGKDYILTDTAGIRRKRSVEVQTIEHYSVIRALAAIRNSDVAVLVVDATEGLTEQDVRLAGYIDELGKPSVLVINKWDLVEKDTHTMVAFNKNLLRDLAFMPYFKSIYISALTGQRIGEIMKAVEFVLERAQTRITTGALNDLITGFVATNPPPFVSGKKAKFFYSTQVGTAPPAFAMFVRNPESVPSTYLRYLENCLRKSVDFTGTPIKLYLRDKSGKDEG